ncbi:MAG TPA: ComF family protein [Ignavibacteria bacterium]|nr:ComF family protein [Ignavibacteria bacterium]
MLNSIKLNNLFAMNDIIKKTFRKVNILYHSILDFVYPTACVLTSETIDEMNSNKFIKDENFSLLSRISDKDKTDLINKVKSEYSFSLFAFYEGDEFSKIIYSIKYGGMRKLAGYMGEILGLEFLRNFTGDDIKNFYCIAPVPLHRSRFRERGFNQSELIGKGMSNITGIMIYEDLLLRVKNTSSQTRLNKHRRKLNIENAFEINSKYQAEIYGKNIIILDDVITTGSTINEAVKILKLNGAGEIMSCSLAMARD